MIFFSVAKIILDINTNSNLPINLYNLIINENIKGSILASRTIYVRLLCCIMHRYKRKILLL